MTASGCPRPPDFHSALNKALAAIGILLLFGGAARAEQPIAAVHDIQLRLDPASGEIRIDDRVSIEGRADFDFNLAPWLEIESLAIDGVPASPRRSGARWRVSLPDAGRHRLEFALAGKLPPLDAQGGESSGSSADGAYLPGYDRWIPIAPGEPMRYRLRVEVPGTQRAVATGELVEEGQQNGSYFAVFERDLPAEAPSLFAGPYSVRESRQEGLRLRTYFHPGLEEYADAYLDAARQYIERYSVRIGAYPYADFHVISAPIPVGLGFPNLTYVGRQVIPLPFMRGRSLAHEVLHNWWGNGVGVDYANGNWSEGLTTYLADYALAREQGETAARSMRIQWLRDYAALPEARDRPVRDFVSRRHQASQVIGYNKVAFIFHMLKLEIGRQAFDDGLRTFWREHRFRNAGWPDLRSAFEQSSSRDLGWFFSQWLDRAGAPRPALGGHQVERTASGYRTSIEILQPVAGYRFQLPVLLTTANGLERHEITVSESLTRVQWDTDARPLSIQFDPDSDLFRRLQKNEAPPILRDITLDPTSSTIIAPWNGDFAAIAQRLAARLFESEPRIEDWAQAAKSTQPLLLIVRSDQLPRMLDRLQLTLPSALPAIAHSAAAWTARSAAGYPVLVIVADDEAELRALIRPLPHYGGQSYVLFSAGRALERGIWPLTRGALYRELGGG